MISLIGHEPIRNLLADAYERNRLAHAYLFAGPSGVGKHRAARSFAQALLCPNRQHTETGLQACGVCPACKQVSVGSHPDLIEVARPEEKSEFPIDTVHELIERMSLRSTGDYRVAIIDDAETMSDDAANALLKTLEEPPGHSLLILLATNAELMLDTILSRCQLLRFDRLPSAALAQILLEQRLLAPLLKDSNSAANNEAPDADEVDDAPAGKRGAKGKAKAKAPAKKKKAATPSNEPTTPLLASDIPDLPVVITLAQGSIGRAVELADQETLGCYTLFADVFGRHKFSPRQLAEQLNAIVEASSTLGPVKRRRARLLISLAVEIFSAALRVRQGISWMASEPIDQSLSSEQSHAAPRSTALSAVGDPHLLEQRFGFVLTPDHMQRLAAAESRIQKVAQEWDEDQLVDALDRSLQVDSQINYFLAIPLSIDTWLDDLARIKAGEPIRPIYPAHVLR